MLQAEHRLKGLDKGFTVANASGRRFIVKLNGREVSPPMGFRTLNAWVTVYVAGWLDGRGALRDLAERRMSNSLRIEGKITKLLTKEETQRLHETLEKLGTGGNQANAWGHE